MGLLDKDIIMRRIKRIPDKIRASKQTIKKIGGFVAAIVICVIIVHWFLCEYTILMTLQNDEDFS